MHLIKAIIIAFSMYSAIPVPQFEWKEKDMRYVMCFFPWVGVVIGALEVGWGFLCRQLSLGNFCFALVGTAIPLLVTGGFHADGFMDTMDAFHSYQDRERKLEILKDSHIGAFSVLMLVLYYLIYAAAFSELREFSQLLAVGIGFVLSRTLSGISVAAFRPARKDGLLRLFADAAARRTVTAVLILEFLICAGVLLYLSVKTGILVLVAALGSFAYYRYRSYRELDGITGDTAGYFLLCCEAAIVIAAVVSNFL